MWYQFQWVFLWRPEICYLTTSTEMQLRSSFDWFGRFRNILFSAQRRRWCVNDLSTSCKTFNKHANLCSISCSFLALFCMRQTFNTANSRQGVTRPIWRELCLHHKKCFFFFFFYIVLRRHVSGFGASSCHGLFSISRGSSKYFGWLFVMLLFGGLIGCHENQKVRNIKRESNLDNDPASTSKIDCDKRLCFLFWDRTKNLGKFLRRKNVSIEWIQILWHKHLPSAESKRFRRRKNSRAS